MAHNVTFEDGPASGNLATGTFPRTFSATGDYAYVEAEWNADPGTDPAHGVPTSYYTAVQLLCRAEVVDGDWLEHLYSQNPKVAEEAARQLQRLGAGALPGPLPYNQIRMPSSERARGEPAQAISGPGDEDA